MHLSPCIYRHPNSSVLAAQGLAIEGAKIGWRDCRHFSEYKGLFSF